MGTSRLAPPACREPFNVCDQARGLGIRGHKLDMSMAVHSTEKIRVGLWNRTVAALVPYSANRCAITGPSTISKLIVHCFSHPEAVARIHGNIRKLDTDSLTGSVSLDVRHCDADSLTGSVLRNIRMLGTGSLTGSVSSDIRYFMFMEAVYSGRAAHRLPPPPPETEPSTTGQTQ